MKKEFGILILLLALCVATTIMNHDFISRENLTNQATTIGMYGIFSIGAGLVIITGGIDLSVGSMLALVGVLLQKMLVQWHWPWLVAAVVAVGIPMVLGVVHGFLITKMRIQAFIITLCGLLIYRGLARFITEDDTVGFGSKGFDTLRYMANGLFLGVPMPFVILMVISVIMWVVLHRSVYGRYLLAVGRNEEAVRFSGIRTRLVIGSSYVLAGMLTGISAILFAFYTDDVQPSAHGNFFELYGIAAAVLGGCSLQGGEGSITGILIGTALLIVLRNLVNLLGISSSLEYAVMGTVVLVGVLADQILRTRAEKKRSRQ